ncbi:Penicillin-insensitive murein endopeptidase [hydrothermal vent metagenome]|uniref:Penicillin-insensitive murein endopeptidase n=1 Tax=hydrothermal vent metagenome TaxID=652676 RepID=A0A3B0SID3_9ZZZZ
MSRYLRLISLTFGLASCGGAVPEPVLPQPVISTQSIPAAMQGVQARQLFGKLRAASRQSTLPYGSYAKGCVAGAQQLPETGPTWQAVRLSRNRNWGHPALIDFIRKLSAKVARMPGWNGLYIGDMSQPRGGPMLTGHRSHQIGLDADIWLKPTDNLNLSVAARENLPPISMRRSNGAFTNSNWTEAQHKIIKAAAQDPRTARIFLFPGAKVQMCKDEPPGDRAWLNKVRPWWGHYYHFHLRLKCPEGAGGCVDQAPPPPGDGCAEAQEWVDNILNPPPPDPNAPPPKPRRELTMQDLPGQCVAVLQSQ